MNWKTTVFLALLVAVGGLAWLLMPGATEIVSGPTVQFLDHELTPEHLTRIAIVRGDSKMVLEQAAGGGWSLPGRWPVRANEVKELVDTLTDLHARFVPIATGATTKLKQYGLDPAPLVVKVTVKGKEHTLAFGEEQSESNRFSRATFVRLDDQKEIVRLAPGLIAALDRPQEYYQLRRLFTPENVAKDNDSAEPLEQVSAKALAVKSPEGSFDLAKVGDAWQIAAPVKDHVDPDKLKALLAAFPEIWAERFVDTKGKKLADFGLEKPTTVLTVTQPGGAAVKLLVGKESAIKFRKVAKAAPPQQPFMPPQQEFEKVPEVYRFAKLENNEQVFEIKADKLKDIGLSLPALRDAQLARFRADRVKRLEIDAPSVHLVFDKDKDHWHMDKPKAEDAENGPVNDLLEKLAGLQAKDKDVLDAPDPKAVGLEKPASKIKITIEEEKGAKDNKTKMTRTLVFDVGAKEKDKDKVYIRVEGWPRVNAVDDSLRKLVDRPEYVYRKRQVLDLAVADIGKLEVQRGPESYSFQQDKGAWKMTAPVQAGVDAGKVSKLAGDLGKLAVVEFITDQPKADELDKVYGLAKPALTVRVARADAKKPAYTIAVGKPRGDKEYYARLDNGPVFVVKKDLREELDRDSLAYRPLEVMHEPKDKIRELAMRKADQDYRLVSDGKTWKVRGPFDAPADTEIVEPMAEVLADLRANRYVTHSAKDLKEYGLDKPYLTVRLVPTAKEDAEQQLLIGKPVDKEASRFAKLTNSPAIFVLADKTVAILDHGPLDFLNKKLLDVDARAIQKVRSAGPISFTLARKKDVWDVVESPAPPFVPEEDAVQMLLRPWANLRAERVAAYGPKIDWAVYGLDKPVRVITVTVAVDKDKATEHKLALGKETDKGMAFARLDKQDEVAVLDVATVAALASSYLDLVNHNVLRFDLDTVTGIERRMSGADLDLVKMDDSWRFAKPDNKAADEPTVDALLKKMFHLRADRVAAYPAKDLAAFGLDKPAAVVTLKLTDIQGAKLEHVIKVGKRADDKKEERYALVDKGDAVVVLEPDVSRQLVAPPLYFANRYVPGLVSADKAILERPGRKITFTRSDTAWSMTEPTKAEAENTELDDLVQSLRRLRAEEMVALKGADLKTYGLDKPDAQWHFFDGTKAAMDLLVGKVDKDGGRYAKLGNGDAVFTLNPKLSGRLVDEYRSRKPWPALDAAQVDKLSYKGPMSFVLTKKDNDWSLSTNPGAKIDAKQVTDTLDALASLKAIRYIVDAKADLKLYGLDPAVWTIEVEISMGKRTLLIGRTEGGTASVYATVPGSGAVFILGEAEAQRILRPMRGFLK